ncbi:MAG: aldehyde dehydrogenase family protein, partial [Candidatus Rokuibacteriota bacterium]
MAIQSVNPATGVIIETLEASSKPQIEQALARAHAAFLEWRARPVGDRAALMGAAARELRSGKAEYALTMTREMGKPITQGEAEVEKCAGTCDYYAEHAESFLAPHARETD